MSDLINHAEAFELAHYRKANSNVARCYLDHCETIEHLKELLRECQDGLDGVVMSKRARSDFRLSAAINAAIKAIDGTQTRKAPHRAPSV